MIQQNFDHQRQNQSFILLPEPLKWLHGLHQNPKNSVLTSIRAIRMLSPMILMKETNCMHNEALNEARYFLDKPVDENTANMVLTFLSHLNQKIEDESQLFLTANVSRIQWLKTGAALKDMNPEYLDTDLSELVEGTPILAVWSSSWVCEEVSYYADGAESGTRYDDVFLIDARLLGEACETDNPQLGYHMDYHDIDASDGDFKTIGLPEEGYHNYINSVLSGLDYSLYGDVDVEYAKQTHPIIRDYIASQLALYWNEEDADEE